MKRWPHAPPHLVRGTGTYMVTAGTYLKQPFFDCDEKLSLLENSLLACADEMGWSLQAWAVFNNHYHFVGAAPDVEDRLGDFVTKLHRITARALNSIDGQAGRKVWHQFWDTKITFEASHFARLAYVHHNPVRHGLVSVADQYPWCSAEWFRQSTSTALYETMLSFKTDRVNVYDDF